MLLLLLGTDNVKFRTGNLHADEKMFEHLTQCVMYDGTVICKIVVLCLTLSRPWVRAKYNIFNEKLISLAFVLTLCFGYLRLCVQYFVDNLHTD